MINNFGLNGFPGSVIDMLQLGLCSHRSPQLRELWSACFVSTLWFIWSSRNKTKYDGFMMGAERACSLISGHIFSSSE